MDEYFIKRPSAVEINLDFELERFLKEMHYLRMPPLNIELDNVNKEMLLNLKDDYKLRYSNQIKNKE